jgi:hypothetical protein
VQIMNDRRALTRSRIEKAKVPPGAHQIMLWDTVVAGFGVRCLPGGGKTFVFRYRPHGGGRSVNPRLLRLDSFPSISLATAREAARIHAGAVAKGEDPAQQPAEERRRNRATLGKLLAEDGPYELHLKERGLVNIKTVLSSLRRGLKAYMAADVAALSRNDIVTAVSALTKIGKPGTAADLRKHSRTFCEWAVEQGLTKFNVMAGLRAPGRTRQQRLRDAEQKGKALTDAELVKVWRAAQALQDRSLGGERIAGSFGGLVQLGLLTGMRRGELSQLQRDRHVLTGDRAIDNRGHRRRAHPPAEDHHQDGGRPRYSPDAADARGDRGAATHHQPAAVSITLHWRPVKGLDHAGGDAAGFERRRCQAARPAPHRAHPDVAARHRRGHRRAGHRPSARRSGRAL